MGSFHSHILPFVIIYYEHGWRFLSSGMFYIYQTIVKFTSTYFLISEKLNRQEIEINYIHSAKGL